MSFYDLYNKINGGEPSKFGVQYDLEDYTKQLTSSPVNGTEDGTWALTPLTQDDMSRYAADDVVDAYTKMHQGKNPLGLGDPLDDEGMKQYTGMPNESVLNEEDKKIWRAKRGDIIDLWGKLRPYLPINAEPVPRHHEGTRYRYDGIRITGTSSFVNAILSRVKDLLRYDNYPGLKVDVEYEQIKTKEHQLKEGPRFVCYIHVAQDKVKVPPQK